MDARAERQGRAALPAQTGAVIVGAGFAGLYLLHLMRRIGVEAVAIEAGGGVGGTWYWNRYPGARCDIESVQYSFSFDRALEQDWTWSERYAAQPEILAYAEHVADRHDLWRDVAFGRRVTAAHYDEAAREWTLTTDRGERVTAPFAIMATGCLSKPNVPRLPGMEGFRGRILQTGRWPHEPVSFAGERVAVIGTGSSAIQSIPVIAREAAELTVFQRTANYSVPAWNRPLTAAEVAAVKADYPALRARQRQAFTANAIRFDPASSALADDAAAREAEYDRRWREGGLAFVAAYADLLRDPAANDTAAEFVRAKIRAIVTDPETAERLCPTNAIGCKRLCVDTGYYETFNRANVRLVDVSETRLALDGDAVVAGDERVAVDTLVLATGFDAMTGALLAIDIRGRARHRLAEDWADGPRAYLGLGIAGYPNLFTVTGPGSPSVFTNMIPSIEHHAEWIAGCIGAMRAAGQSEIEVEPEAEVDWVAHNLDVASTHLRSSCASWYTGANVEGKPQVFMPYIGGFPRYVDAVEAITKAGYRGFRFA